METDTVISKNHKGALLTINDRAAGYVWIRKLKAKDANALYLKL
jgi:IS30 family transposase